VEHIINNKLPWMIQEIEKGPKSCKGSCFEFTKELGKELKEAGIPFKYKWRYIGGFTLHAYIESGKHIIDMSWIQFFDKSVLKDPIFIVHKVYNPTVR